MFPSLAQHRRPARAVALAALVAAATLVALVAIDPPTSSRSTRSSSDHSTAQPSREEERSLAGRIAAKQDGADGAAQQIGEAGAGASGSSSADASIVAPQDGETRLLELEQASPNVDGALAPTPSPSSSASGAPDIGLHIVRTGDIALNLKRGTFDDAYADAQRTASILGGYVVDATRTGLPDKPRHGSLTIRVPADRFDDAVDRLRGIDGAKVRRLDIASQDVTQEYVDTQARLRHDRRIEARLSALVADADGVSEVLAVQAQLDQVQEQIEVAKGRLRYLDTVTELSTISITLREPGAASRQREERDEATRAWGVRDAFDDAAHRAVDNVNAVIVWLGGALPALIVFGGVALVARVAVRRHLRSRSDA